MIQLKGTATSASYHSTMVFDCSNSHRAFRLRVRRNGGRWEAWLCDEHRPMTLAASVGVALARDAAREGQDLVGALFDQALARGAVQAL